MNTDLKSAIKAEALDFGNDILEQFSEYDLHPHILKREHRPCATVDLSLVVGTEHGDYAGKMWQELLGSPLGESGALKRLRGVLLEMRSNPEYYTSYEPKEHWSFCCVNGKIYVSEGMHRTVFARYLLWCNGLSPHVHGVGLTTLTLRSVEGLRKC